MNIWLDLLFLLPLTSPLQGSCSDVSNMTNTTTSSQTQQACLHLQETLGSSVVQNVSGPTYETGATASWNLFNTEFKPSCIVFPREESHVQTAMKAIYDADIDYAVQAGGHSAMKGWNNVQNGVLISFLFMNGTSYDAEKDTITLLPGIRWGEAVSALEPQGVAPVGGRINDVGTGLLLGGGLSFLSPAYGYASDMFVSLDVVLVNGDMVTATVDNEYADLFRALKGGANRFGIVTKYEVQAVHTGTKDNKAWYGGQIFYNSSASEAVLEAIASFVRNTTDPNAVHLTYFTNVVGPNSTVTSFISANLFYNGTSSSFNETFSPFLSIPSTASSLGPLSYLDISNLLAEPANASGHGELFGAKVLSGAADSDDYAETVQLYTNFSTTFASQLESTVLAFTPVRDHQIMIGRERGGNSMDPPIVDGTGGYNAIQFQVTLPLGVQEISEEMEDGRQYFFSQAPSTPGLPLFINECDVKQDVFETYGGYEFLKSTYAKYDPTRFNMGHMQGPKGL